MDVTRPLRRQSAGVTLLEMLTTGTIALTLTAVAVPAVSQFTTAQETATATNSLVADLALARHEAVTRLSRVVLCPSSDGNTCTGGYDWSDGWLSFVDEDGDSRVDEDELRLTVTENPTKRVHIETSPGRHKIAYRSDGSAAGTNLTFSICNAADPDRRRAVIVNPAGRARLSQRKADGTYIKCD